jgi:hypothetical protein
MIQAAEAGVEGMRSLLDDITDALTLLQLDVPSFELSVN